MNRHARSVQLKTTDNSSYICPLCALNSELDKTLFLEEKAKSVNTSIDGHFPRQEWKDLSVMLNFSGRPKKKGTVLPYRVSDDGEILDTTEAGTSSTIVFWKA